MYQIFDTPSGIVASTDVISEVRRPGITVPSIKESTDNFTSSSLNVALKEIASSSNRTVSRCSKWSALMPMPITKATLPCSDNEHAPRSANFCLVDASRFCTGVLWCSSKASTWTGSKGHGGNTQTTWVEDNGNAGGDNVKCVDLFPNWNLQR